MHPVSDPTKTRTFLKISGILLLIAVPYFILLTGDAIVGKGGFSLSLLLYAAAAPLFFLAPVAWFVHRSNRFARGLVRSRACEGLICPHCLGRPATTPEESPCCAKAPLDWSAEEYRTWWEAAAKGDASRHQMPLSGAASRHLRPGLMTFFMTAMGAMRITLPGTSWDVVSVIEALLPFALLGYGVDLIVRGSGRWRARHLVCAQCGYPRHATAGDSQRCSECGNEWRKPGGTRLERSPPSPRFYVAGGAVILVGLLLMAQVAFIGNPWLRRIQPTNGLIRAATSSSSTINVLSRNAVWDELNRRALTAEEQSRLFHAVLDRRLTTSFMFGPPSAFVGAYLASPLATEEDLRRYRAESFRPGLIHPAQVRRGDMIPITLRGVRLEEFLPPAHGVTIHLGGAWFEGEEPPPPSGGRGYWTLDVDQANVRPALELRAERPGEQTFTVRLWLVARRYGLLDNPIDWNPDGTPILPDDALWAEPVDLKRSVRVEP